MGQEKNKDVIAAFRRRTEESFHLVNGCTASDFEDCVYNIINSYVEEYSPGTEIIDVVLTGSRARGLEKADSDMDFVLAYNGEMKEDELFNLLNKENLYLAGVKIDINPIRPEQTGTLEEYLSKAEEYLFEKEFTMAEDKAAYRNKVISDYTSKTYSKFHSINGLEAVDLEQAVFTAVEGVIKAEAIDAEILKVLLSGSRARGIEQSNSNLNFILEYYGDIKELELYNILNENPFKINNTDISIEIEVIRSEESGPLENYLLKNEEYLLVKEKEYEQKLYKRWQDVAIEYGYPITIGNSIVVFPEEYHDFFSSDERNRLKKIMIDMMNKPKVKNFETIKEEYIESLIKWDRKDYRKKFVVAKTSKAMSSIGLDDRDITLDAVKLNRIFKYHPAMTLNIIMQLPDIINEPVFILSSKQKESRIVASGEVFDGDNNPVVVVMELKPKGKNGVELDEIKIASAYGKENIQYLIATSQILYLTEDKEKINRWLKCTGLQLPFGSTTIDSTFIISQYSENATNELKEKQTGIIMEKDSVHDSSHTKMYTNAVLQEEKKQVLAEKLKQIEAPTLPAPKL